MTRPRFHLIAVVVTLSVVGGGCGEVASEYPPEAVEDFLASCDAQPNATRAMCECSAERVQESFTYEEFRREDRAIAEGRPASSRLLEVFARCRGRRERYPYPPQVLGNFVTSCEAKGGTRSECGCAADELQNKLPFEERSGGGGDRQGSSPVRAADRCREGL